MMTPAPKYTAEGSSPVTFRFTPDQLATLDALTGHLTRQRAGNVTRKVSRAEVVRHALNGLYERAADQIAADHAAWAALVEIGGDTATLTLHGEGRGEPLPEEYTPPTTTPDGRKAIYLIPSRWAKLEVTAKLDGEPIDVPLIVEEPDGSDITVEVFLTDDEGKARIYLGTLSRTVESHPAYYDNRLYRIADQLRLR